MFILGIHQGHDSSTALVKDGRVIAAAAEERFTRIKHYGLLPWRSLEFCLNFTKIQIKDVDLIVFPSIAKNELLQVIFGRQKEGLFSKNFPEEKKSFFDYLRVLALKGLRYLDFHITPSQPPTYIKKFPYPKGKPIWHIDHHLAHVASTYYTSGFQEKTLVITVDGSGDGLSTTVWVGEKGRLTPRLKLTRPASLGAFYGLITESLGWWVGDGEGKTMGLACYGNTKKTKGLLDHLHPHYENGLLKRGYHWGWPGIWEEKATFHYHCLDKQVNYVQKLIKKYGPENVAAEAQRVLEQEMKNLIIPWIKKEKVKYLAAAGGVFLNVKANQRIWETGLLKDFFVFPDAGDGGTAAGAALYGYFANHQKKYQQTSQIKNIFWGPQYSFEEIEAVLKTRNLKYQKFSQKELIKKAAEILSQNKTIGWFAGRMEIGPRALGHRSILMSPLRPENKDLINSNIKYREPFRPFCPSMIDKAAQKYLVQPTPNPAFMIFSFAVPPDKAKKIPAVVHVDGTARPQVVKEIDESLFYRLLEEFGKITGVPVLLNTSFNIRGDPIVCSPEDAIKCFYDTGLDYLIFEGQILISKAKFS